MVEISAAPPTMADMLRGYSIEVNPSESRIVDAALGRLDPGTQVFVNWIPGANPGGILATAARLRRAGLFPVPHIGARHIESATQLERFVGQLAGEAGVDRVLVIGGDREKPAGPYDSSLAVMQTGVLQNFGITRIAVAGFPEGNPNIPDPVLAEALAAKARFARSAGLQMSIVTQFCFESRPIVKWLRRIRAAGIHVPVRIGFAGPAGLLALVRYAVRCGVGNSLHVLKENPSFAKLLIEKGPEPLIRELAAESGPRNGSMLPLGIAGLHFYVFGSFNKTVDWIDARRSR
jgi:methylenetetrahydrofolate reductase (NADPH)